MHGPGSIGAVILAAGESRRFGSAKQLAQLHGRTLLEHVIRAAEQTGLSPIVAVVPAWLGIPASAPAALAWVANPSPELGMGHSLKLGFAALSPGVQAAIVLLGDQPLGIGPVIEALLAARGLRPVVAAEADGVAGPPVLVERSHFGLVQELRGDIGLREVIRDNPGLVRIVPLTARPPDVDTPADLERLSRP